MNTNITGNINPSGYMRIKIAGYPRPLLIQWGFLAEQGGSGAVTRTITLPQTYINDYRCFIGYESSLVANKADYGPFGNKTTSSFQVVQYWDISINWLTIGE